MRQKDEECEEREREILKKRIREREREIVKKIRRKKEKKGFFLCKKTIAIQPKTENCLE